MTTEQQLKKAPPPRFSAGKLVMLSRKNTYSGTIAYYYPLDINDAVETSRRGRIPDPRYEQRAGLLDRGEPILILEEPQFIDNAPLRPGYSFGQRRRDTKIKYWKIKFLYEEKVYHLYLTMKQYNHELVRAVPKRLKKDYALEANKKGKKPNQ